MPNLTSLTSRYGLSVPLVLPPMLGASGGKLAGAVSRAGGLGFVAWSPGPAAALSSELALARQIAGPSASLGVGVQLWQLDARGQEGLDVFSTIAAATDVRSLWLFAGDWKRWVEKLRGLERQAGLGEAAAKDIWLQVGSVAEAKEALESKLIDVLVVQGSEAGGHGLIASTPLNSLLSQIISLNRSSSSPIPIVAAGGLMNGFDLAHVLSLGAAGGAMGTRFLMTTQSKFPLAKKSMVANAREGREGHNATERSVAWDRLAGAQWPQEYDGRALVNRSPSLYAALTHKNDDFDELKRDYAQAVAEEDYSFVSVYAGVGAGLIRKEENAEYVVREVQQQLESSLAASSYSDRR
ncbi:2-nitropropane dioxygenase [Mrakia frigida]|uniref:nitronate monooxygenase n=1 Tax=Mrakia frigida TaxID=29902 RepID=UPI003FCC1682